MSILQVVSKAYGADEGAGSALVEMVVYDYLTDLAEAYRPAFNATVGPWALERVQVAKRNLARGYVSKAVGGQYPDGETQQAAEWLAGLERYLVAAVAPVGVSKAFEWWERNGKRTQQSVERTADGRFAREIGSDQGRGVNPAGLQRDAIHPQVRAYTDDTGKIDPGTLSGGVTEERLRFAQRQWQEAEQFVGQLSRGLPSSVRDESDAVLWIKRDGGGMRSVRIPLKDVKNGRIPSLGAQMPQVADTLSHVEIAPGGGASRETMRQIAALNVLGSTGSEAAISVAMTDRKKWDALASSMSVDPKSRDTKLTRFFGQMAAGGAVLSGVPGADQYGRFAEFVGAVGPEAEKVLGPYVQRAAYRYRGTETSPDRELVRAFNSGDMAQVSAIASGSPLTAAQEAAVAQTLNGRSAERYASRAVINAAQRRRDGLSGDSLKMQVRSDMAAARLVQDLPKDPIIARLSELSGSILPSQGFLINAQGKVVSQAVGFADDHYLPFDLKNLSALRGGQYVRTRQSGGLTGEDVYAAVTMGARMATVASPSGVFTLEMAPDFRGARSMSDKARGMYDRYLKILDAVDASKEYLEDIPASEKAKITQDVKALRLGKERTDELVAERIEAAREKAQQLTPEQIDGIEQDLLRDRYRGVPREALRGADARRFADELSDAVEGEQAKLSNRLRLNGQGYAVALSTLKQQYPYFIKAVRYESLNDFAAKQGLAGVKGREFATDRGYVAPGGLKARSTREGFNNPAGERQWKGGGGDSGAPASAPAAGPTASAAASAASAAGTPDSASAQSPSPNIGVKQRLNDKAGQLEKMRDKAALDLAREFGRIPRGVKEGNLQPGNASTPMASVTGNPAQLINWLISQDENSLLFGMKDPAMSLPIIDALSDRKALTTELEKRLTDAGGADDYFNGGSTFGGADNLEEAVDWAVDTARTAADALLLQDPFTGDSTAGKDSWRAPTVDPVISAISTKEQLLDYASSQKATWDMAVDLANDGDDYESLTGVARKAREKLKGFDAVLKVQADFKAALSDPNRETKPKVADLRTPEVAAALGKPIGDITEADILDANPDDLKRPILAAWQLAATGRALEYLEGGEVFPKDRSQRWLVRKSIGRLRVLGASDPLTRAVQERVAKGMPFVPRRRASRTSLTGSTRIPA